VQNEKKEEKHRLLTFPDILFLFHSFSKWTNIAAFDVKSKKGIDSTKIRKAAVKEN